MNSERLKPARRAAWRARCNSVARTFAAGKVLSSFSPFGKGGRPRLGFIWRIEGSPFWCRFNVAL
jgi:hypothetical protein